MSSIIRQRVGKYIYLYESTSYRNEEGKPRNKRTIIGKIDPQTGLPVYKPEYLERMAKLGTPVDVPQIQQSFSIEDIRKSTIKEFGSFYLFENIAKEIGLLNILEDVFPNTWQFIFNLASYLVASGEPAMYCEDWIAKTESFSVGSMSSQRISELMSSVTLEERQKFFEKWGVYRSEQEYLALDITSISSYSQFIGDVEWGYNRDGENLPQINLCMLFGEKSKLPVFQSIYSGSLKDVCTLKTTLAQTSNVYQGNLMLVLDKGFCSTKNINAMLSDPQGIKFVIAMPFTHSFAKRQVESERKDIDRIENTIVIGEDVFRGISKKRSWNTDHRIYTHIYYNVTEAVKAQEELYGHITKLVQEAEKDPNNPKYASDFQKYLIIRKSKKRASGYSITIRDDVVKEKLSNIGWLVLISNHISDAEEALAIYRLKDVIEKGFMRLKNCLDLGRLRVHNDNSMQNKVFVGFIALILMAHIHKVMLAEGLYKKVTMKKLIKTLEKLRVQTVNGNRILYPLTKEQKVIYKAFGLAEPL